MKKSCLVCNKEFYKAMNVSLNSWKNRVKYCSRICYVTTLIGKRLSQETEFKKGRHPSIKTEFRKGDSRITGVNNSNWKGGKPKCKCGKIINYCSKQCRSCYGLDQGKTLLNKLARNKFRKTMQKLIFERDNYTCQMCGVSNGNGKTIKLQVDHIQPWAEYVELRFSMDNCRTLCEDCHYFVTWGKKKPENVQTWGHNFKYTLQGGDN